MGATSWAKFSPEVNGDGEGASVSRAVPTPVLQCWALPGLSTRCFPGVINAFFVQMLVSRDILWPSPAITAELLHIPVCCSSRSVGQPSWFSSCLHPEGFFFFFPNPLMCIFGFVGLPSYIQLRLGCGCKHWSCRSEDLRRSVTGVRALPDPCHRRSVFAPNAALSAGASAPIAAQGFCH